MKRQVIFFDIGKTLATAAEISPRRLLASRLHLSEKETKRAGRMMMTARAYSPSVFAESLWDVLPNRDPEELLQMVEGVWHEQAESVCEIPGAIDLIRSLRSTGFRLGVISNTWFPLFEGFRRVFSEVMELFEYIFLSFQEGCKKPSQEIFRRAMARTGTAAACHWMVGDSYELDMNPAMEAGMKTLWVLSSLEREQSLIPELLRGERRIPDWVVNGIDEILPFFHERRS